MRLAGKVAVIAGTARRSIGAAIARQFVEEGAKVAILDRTGRRLVEHLNRICPHSSVFIEADLTCEESLKTAIARVEEHFGRIDILVSGIGCRPKSEQVPSIGNIGEPIFSADFRSTLLAIRTAASSMRRNGNGAIVNFVLRTADRGGPLLHRALLENYDVPEIMERESSELDQIGIRINSIMIELSESIVSADKVCGLGASNKTDYNYWRSLKRDAARMAVFLASDLARLCTGGRFSLDGTASVSKAMARPSYVLNQSSLSS